MTSKMPFIPEANVGKNDFKNNYSQETIGTQTSVHVYVSSSLSRSFSVYRVLNPKTASVV
jgi:hypothetical protein